MMFCKYVVLVVTALVSNCYSEESIVLSYDSNAVKQWESSDFELRIHLFNYTNAAQYLNGEDKKLIVEEVGPFVYQEKIRKVNITFNGNGTVSYREKRSYTFLPEKSVGHEFEKITLPNIPLLTASSYLRDKSMLYQYLLNSFFAGIKAVETHTVHDFLWGYEDSITKVRNYVGLDIDRKFGMLRKRNATSSDIITIFTGENDIEKLSLRDRFNGKSKMNFWSTDECNHVNGTNGSQFPPHWVDKKQPLQVFLGEFCRKFPFVYVEEMNILNDIPSYRYKIPLNVFAHPDNITENSCYCNTQTNECPPSGLFNASLCFDAPIFLSFPHFLAGDTKLFENIEGMNPNEEKHLSNAYIHHRLGFTIDGASRFQINVQVQKAPWLAAMNPLLDGQYLPVVWIVETLGDR